MEEFLEEGQTVTKMNTPTWKEVNRGLQPPFPVATFGVSKLTGDVFPKVSKNGKVDDEEVLFKVWS